MEPLRVARFGALGAFAILVAFTPLFGNLWSLVTGAGWYLPAESTVFTFTETRANEGSGEWWIAGEDGRNFYAQASSESGYLVISREAAAACAGFDRFDTSTWCMERAPGSQP